LGARGQVLPGDDVELQAPIADRVRAVLCLDTVQVAPIPGHMAPGRQELVHQVATGGDEHLLAFPWNCYPGEAAQPPPCRQRGSAREPWRPCHTRSQTGRPSCPSAMATLRTAPCRLGPVPRCLVGNLPVGRDFRQLTPSRLACRRVRSEQRAELVTAILGGCILQFHTLRPVAVIL
jgi:hypothetical protein